MPHPPNRLNAIRALRGQTKEVELTIRTAEGRVPPLTGAILIMTVRAAVDDENFLFQKKTGDGIATIDASKGRYKITLSSSDMDLDIGSYKYDVWADFGGDPAVRKPVVKASDLVIQSGVTTFP